ncbi:MAG: OmpA family protein [Candidatus Zixiibacteriota bacterium]|nr:MAG: OmpA family protein [candidate division Zixibacteria bacterium]
MILKDHKLIVILGITCLISFLVWGCATKSFVLQKTDEVDAKTKANKAKIDKLETDLSATDAKADQALSEARKALKKAEEAAGYVNYRLIGERDVNFDFDKFDLTLATKDILDEIGASMQGNPALIMEIEGHCDNSGPEGYNLALGQRRAQSVKRYLADRFGIPIHRFFHISHGEFKPKELNDSRSGREANRRAVVRLLGPPGE